MLSALGTGLSSLAGSVAARLVETRPTPRAIRRDVESDGPIDLTEDPEYGTQLDNIGSVAEDAASQNQITVHNHNHSHNTTNYNFNK